MLRILSVLTLLAVSLAAAAADLEGTFVGTLQADGEERVNEAYVIFKSVDGKLTGTGGPDANQQMPFSNLKLEGDRLTFELSNPNGMSMKFDLKVEGDKIGGKVTAERDGQSRTATLKLDRKK
ncbi:MAG: hypothetical protein K2Q23_13045 [Bryobacteraceae bacterium]|nr:hypothetical protein [Bryobacteraceae bacterium]